jgi:hypothetical protein
MSATRDPIGISSTGIQRIVPTTGTSWRVTKRKPEDGHDTDDTQSKPNHASPSPQPSGIGKLVDKAV